MKSGSNRRKKRTRDWDEDDAPEREAPRRQERPRRGGRRRLFVLLLLFVAFVALLPTIVLKTPLRDLAISRLAANTNLRVTVGTAEGGWITPIALTAIQVTDAASGELIAIESVRSDLSLASLLLDSQNLGTLDINKTKLRIAIRPDGSNLEDVLARLTESFGGATPSDATGVKSSPGATSVTLRIAEGVVVVEDTSSSRIWQLRNAELATTLVAGELQSLALAAQLSDSAAPGAVGRVLANLAPPEDGNATSKRQLSWQIENATLAAAAPWLRRYFDGAEMNGSLSGQGVATWTAGKPSANGLPGDFATSGGLAIDGLDMGAALLAGDRVRLARVELPWRMTAQVNGLLPSGLFVEQLELRSEVGRVGVRGNLDPQVLSGVTASNAASPAAMGEQEIELRGTIDVARLAAMLPRAIRIRADTTITSGTLEIAAKRSPAVNGDTISASLRTTALAATSGGRALRWEQPIQATATLRRAADGVRLDSLECQSEFLAVKAAGTMDEFTAGARFDLNRLAEQLGQFIDLGGVALAGSGEASGRWQLAKGAQFTATSAVKLNQLSVGTANSTKWTETALELNAEANGSLEAASRQLAQVDQARLRIVAQGDELNAQLVGPVAVSKEAAATAWPLTLRAQGGLARWLARVRPWVDVADWQVDGQGNVAANVRVAGDVFAASDVKVSITNLVARNAQWSINEPRVEAGGDVMVDSATGSIAAKSLQLVTSSVAAAAQDVSAGRTAAGNVSAKGSIAFRGDLARLAAWRNKVGANSAGDTVYYPAGQVTGNVVLSQQNDVVRAEVSANGENLTLSRSAAGQVGPSAQRPNVVWQEPAVTLRGLAEHHLASDRLAIQQLQVQSNTLAATINGQIERLSTAAETDLTGTLNYDLAQVTPLLRATLGEGITLAGRETARFAVAGKLLDDSAKVSVVPAGLSINSQPSTLNPSSHWSRRVQARLELPWSGANVYGLPIGSGKLAAALGDGQLRVDPISLAVAEGRLTTSPQVRFDPPPSELMLPAGPLLADVRISPEVSEAMLKYIAPVLSGATERDGKFSLTLAGARVPLENAKLADAGGQLTVHSVRVVPGEMARQWIGLARQIESLAKQGGNPLGALGQQPQQPAATPSQRDITLLSIRDQQVNFRVVEGRVHHENMEFQVEDVVLRSRGSVGFDESISLVLSVPIQDRWIERQKLLAGLRGQSLQIPITGTLRQPRMDQSAVANLSAQLLQGAAGQAVGNELNRALDKLFAPR